MQLRVTFHPLCSFADLFPSASAGNELVLLVHEAVVGFPLHSPVQSGAGSQQKLNLTVALHHCSCMLTWCMRWSPAGALLPVVIDERRDRLDHLDVLSFQLVHRIPEASLNYQKVPPGSAAILELDANMNEPEPTSLQRRPWNREEVTVQSLRGHVHTAAQSNTHLSLGTCKKCRNSKHFLISPA